MIIKIHKTTVISGMFYTKKQFYVLFHQGKMQLQRH